MHFGRWVREERKARRLTATECAKKAGMTVQAWSCMERKTDQPRVDTVSKVASALDMPESAVYQAVMPGSRDASTSDMFLDEIVRLWERVPPSRRSDTSEIVKRVLSLAQ